MVSKFLHVEKDSDHVNYCPPPLSEANEQKRARGRIFK